MKKTFEEIVRESQSAKPATPNAPLPGTEDMIDVVKDYQDRLAASSPLDPTKSILEKLEASQKKQARDLLS